MNRDMDVVRRIILETADMPPDHLLSGLDDVDESTFLAHVEWLDQAGLIVATTSRYMGGGGTAAIYRLTWDGCDFADSVRSDTVWNRAKAKVIKPAGSFTFGILREVLKNEITQGFPTVRTLGQ